MQERAPSPASPEDDIDASKAPLMDHLIELRTAPDLRGRRLLRHVPSSALRSRSHIYNILVWPYIWASGNQQVRLIATHFLEQLFTHVKLAMFGAGVPFLPGRRHADLQVRGARSLQKREARPFVPYLIATPVFFVLGAAVVYFVAMPILIQFSIGLTQPPRAAEGAGGDRTDAESVGIFVADHDVDLRLRHHASSCRSSSRCLARAGIVTLPIADRCAALRDCRLFSRSRPC